MGEVGIVGYAHGILFSRDYVFVATRHFFMQLLYLFKVLAGEVVVVSKLLHRH